jgi:hypothetical protein
MLRDAIRFIPTTFDVVIAAVCVAYLCSYSKLLRMNSFCNKGSCDHLRNAIRLISITSNGCCYKLLYLFFTVTVVVVKNVRPFETVFRLLQLSFHYLTYTG